MVSFNIPIFEEFVKSNVKVTASYRDFSVNVHYETTVTHKRTDGLLKIHEKAVSKMRTFLKKHYTQEQIDRLVNFEVERFLPVAD